MSRRALLLVLAALLPPAGVAAQGAPPAVRIAFVAESDSVAAAAEEYRRLWAAEGERIVAAMERVSGLRFVTDAWADTAITAIVLERASSSGWRDTPMRMRASYPPDTKRATLVHELGHRLQGGLFRRDEEEHVPLFLWVYDTWVELWGRDFADAQVAVERRRGQRYVDAWDAALALTREERAARWRALVAERTPPRAPASPPRSP